MLARKVFCSANSVEMDERCISSTSGSASVDLLHMHWVSMHVMHPWHPLRADMPNMGLSVCVWRSVLMLDSHRLDFLCTLTWKCLKLCWPQNPRWSRSPLSRFINLRDGLRRSRVLQGCLSLLVSIGECVNSLGSVLAKCRLGKRNNWLS